MAEQYEVLVYGKGGRERIERVEAGSPKAARSALEDAGKITEDDTVVTVVLAGSEQFGHYAPDRTPVAPEPDKAP